ncbi:uncharacterized protein ACIB01_017294 [Guaruba guarouba]
MTRLRSVRSGRWGSAATSRAAPSGTHIPMEIAMLKKVCCGCSAIIQLLDCHCKTSLTSSESGGSCPRIWRGAFSSRCWWLCSTPTAAVSCTRISSPRTSSSTWPPERSSLLTLVAAPSSGTRSTPNLAEHLCTIRRSGSTTTATSAVRQRSGPWACCCMRWCAGSSPSGAARTSLAGSSSSSARSLSNASTSSGGACPCALATDHPWRMCSTTLGCKHPLPQETAALHLHSLSQQLGNEERQDLIAKQQTTWLLQPQPQTLQLLKCQPQTLRPLQCQ